MRLPIATKLLEIQHIVHIIIYLVPIKQITMTRSDVQYNVTMIMYIISIVKKKDYVYNNVKVLLIFMVKILHIVLNKISQEHMTLLIVHQDHFIIQNISLIQIIKHFIIVEVHVNHHHFME